MTPVKATQPFQEHEATTVDFPGKYPIDFHVVRDGLSSIDLKDLVYWDVSSFFLVALQWLHASTQDQSSIT